MTEKDFFMLLCEKSGLPIPKKEVRFHPIRRWRVDYLFDEYKLAIECEGGRWIHGRHNRPIGFKKDMEKYNQLTIEGYHLLRFTPQEMKNGYAIDVIATWMGIHGKQ